MMAPRAVLLNDTRVDHHLGCQTVIESIYRLAAENGIDVALAAPAHRDWQKNEAVVRAVGDADLVIVNGDHHDRTATAEPLERYLLTICEFKPDRFGLENKSGEGA